LGRGAYYGRGDPFFRPGVGVARDFGRSPPRDRVSPPAAGALRLGGGGGEGGPRVSPGLAGLEQLSGLAGPPPQPARGGFLLDGRSPGYCKGSWHEPEGGFHPQNYSPPRAKREEANHFLRSRSPPDYSARTKPNPRNEVEHLVREGTVILRRPRPPEANISSGQAVLGQPADPGEGRGPARRGGGCAATEAPSVPSPPLGSAPPPGLTLVGGLADGDGPHRAAGDVAPEALLASPPGL